MSQSNPTLEEATRYAENFILHGDKTKAFRAAFPKSKASDNSAYVAASRLYDSPKVQLRIKELQEASKKHSEEEFSISSGKIKQMLIIAAKQGLKQKKDAQGNMVAVNIGGAVSALSEINKMDGNHAPTKGEIGGFGGGPIEVFSVDKDTYKQARKEMLKDDDC